jgi:hypothetical protein
MAKGTEVFTADQMYGIWVTYNAQGTAFCPVCGEALAIIAERPADIAEDGTAVNMRVSCQNCGRIGKHATS